MQGNHGAASNYASNGAIIKCGWWAYYGRVEDRRSILRLSGWIRRHIRKCFWLRWHNASGRDAASAVKNPTIAQRCGAFVVAGPGAWRGTP